MADSHERSDYIGPGTLTIGGREYAVEVELRGFFQPIDGRYRWYGRARPDVQLHEALRGGHEKAVLKTPGGEASTTVGDVDFWGRYRLEGAGRPPFHLAKSVEEVEAAGIATTATRGLP